MLFLLALLIVAQSGPSEAVPPLPNSSYCANWDYKAPLTPEEQAFTQRLFYELWFTNKGRDNQFEYTRQIQEAQVPVEERTQTKRAEFAKRWNLILSREIPALDKRCKTSSGCAWAESVTFEEKLLLLLYTGKYYDWLNLPLQNGLLISTQELAPIYRSFCSVLDKAPPARGWIFRGMKDPDYLYPFKQAYKNKVLFQDPKFLSFSEKLSRAAAFTSAIKDPTFLIVYTQNGKSIGDYSYNPGEREVILAPNTPLYVHSIGKLPAAVKNQNLLPVDGDYEKDLMREATYALTESVDLQPIAADEDEPKRRAWSQCYTWIGEHRCDKTLRCQVQCTLDEKSCAWFTVHRVNEKDFEPSCGS